MLTAGYIPFSDKIFVHNFIPLTKRTRNRHQTRQYTTIVLNSYKMVRGIGFSQGIHSPAVLHPPSVIVSVSTRKRKRPMSPVVLPLISSMLTMAEVLDSGTTKKFSSSPELNPTCYFVKRNHTAVHVAILVP